MQRVYIKCSNESVLFVQRGCSHRNGADHIEVRERRFEYLKGMTHVDYTCISLHSHFIILTAPKVAIDISMNLPAVILITTLDLEIIMTRPRAVL